MLSSVSKITVLRLYTATFYRKINGKYGKAESILSPLPIFSAHPSSKKLHPLRDLEYSPYIEAILPFVNNRFIYLRNWLVEPTP